MANTKKIDNAPFNLDDYLAAPGDKEPYRFYGFGRDWEMAHIEELDVWDLLAGAEQGDMQAMFAMLKAAFGEEQFTELRKAGPLPQRALNELFTRYKTHCGLDEGESPASTSS